MIKKTSITIGILLVVGIIILLIFNARYPFVNPRVGNWSVGFHNAERIFPEVDINLGGIISYQYINSVTPDEIDYIADPFFIKEIDTFFLFVELKGEGNANIALLTSTDGKNYDYKGIVLDEPFHLSYPQVFKYQNELYMLPETVGANNVILYKAENFPYDWVVIDTLIDNIRLKDPTLLLSDEINLIVGVDDNLKQYIFTADSLTGQWKEHNEYKQRWGNETRPGGRFFKIAGEWYLPLQNRSLGYGTGISLYKLRNRKDRLEFELAERMYLGPQKEIQWFNRGMHHLDVQQLDNEYYMVYDGDRNYGEKEFQYKRTIKFNLIDLYNYFR